MKLIWQMSTSYFVLAFLVGLCCPPDVMAINAANTFKNYELKTSDASLRIDNDGRIQIASSDKGTIKMSGHAESLWSVILKTKTGNAGYQVQQNSNITITREGGRIYLRQDYLEVNNERIKADIVFTIEVLDDAFAFRGTINVDTARWQVKELTYPHFHHLAPHDQDVQIYWPQRGGERFDNPQAFGNRSFAYPSMNGSMPWYTITTPSHGVYLGVHDPQRGAKEFKLSYEKEESAFSTSITFPVYNSDFTVPPVVLNIYKGEWYSAATYYRQWFDRHFDLPNTPEWLRLNAGLMLFIFKQQNGDLMWKYNDIDKLCDIGDKLNIKLIGIWGRGPGGHDALYPNYMPDQAMGGTNELKRAIKRAQERGFKVIVYTNGTIIDVATDYYKYNGVETVVLTERGTPLVDNYVKHKHATPVNFAITSPASSLWRQTMVRLAKDAYDLGVDAFYVDQVGVRPPHLDFNKLLDHKLPQEAYTTYRYKLLDELNTYMKQLHPNYGLMTEGTLDAILPDVDIIHNVASMGPNSFPDMFRFTFPESLVLQLNSTPALSRTAINFDMINGFRHMIHSRYSPDVTYLEEGTIPTQMDYSTGHVNYPPALWTMEESSPEETFSYAHRVIAFENDHEHFFRKGRFISSQGIICRGDDIEAKGYEAGNQLGVVVWNKNKNSERSFAVSVDGYRLIATKEIDESKNTAASILAANSVKLLVFEKVN